MLDSKKREEILGYLNENDARTEDLSDGETIEALGVTFSYSEDSDSADSDVIGYLRSDCYSFKRSGIKEMSYGNWVDTNWVGEWELE
ncbi:hypothetical protein [Alteromonas macleodii]|uniref:hypothetical protein n=1 Tax=Alteromonas macleodii TaxID=28108 RepID=UPI00313FF4C2|tara:strand:+ start:3845 stop:4105 length:261 start_codon:yes stop_codon:yes gene_type:complete